MEKYALYESELKVMDIVWENEPITAKEVSVLAEQMHGWNKNTTYTVLKKLVEKKIIRRGEPGFVCRAIVKKSHVQQAETKRLIDKLYDGSKKAFFSAFIDGELTEEEIDELKKMLDER